MIADWRRRTLQQPTYVDTISHPHEIPLGAPVGAIMRPTRSVAPEDSLLRAASELRLNGTGLLPLARDGVYTAVITEASLARALADSVELSEAASTVSERAVIIPPYATGAEALRKLNDPGVSTLVVVDDRGQLLGLVTASDLMPRRRVLPRPAAVGGMATPFGVYLTNGVVHGGAGHWALLSTGAVMFLILFGAQTFLEYAMPGLVSLGLPPAWGDWAQAALAPVLFLVGMRVIPLSGTHAAEHQVVHAIERGEELTPEIVRRMPRVHPRCGTNIAAAATIFLSIFMTEWVPHQEIRLLTAFFVTMLTWRKVGSLLQEFVTTRPASDRQLEGGIREGKDLLEKYAKSAVASPTIAQRLWNSGILQVIAGSTLTAGVIYVVCQALDIPVSL